MSSNSANDSTTKVSVAMTTKQKKSFIYLSEAHKNLNLKKCEQMEFLQVAENINANKMRIIATTIPTLGSPDEPVYKAFSSLINIPNDDTFKFALDFFKYQHEKEAWYEDRSNYFGSYIKKIEDAITNRSPYEVGRVIKDIKGNIDIAKFVKDWKKNFKDALEVKDIIPDSVSKDDLKKGFTIGQMDGGDFLVKGKGRVGKLKSTIGKILTPFSLAYDLEDIYKDYKNQSLASMSLRILSTGLGLSSIPQLQALGGLFGFARFSADKLGTFAGEQVAKIFDQQQTPVSYKVDDWNMKSNICNEDDINKPSSEDKTEKDFKDDAFIEKSDYQNLRIISPLINSLLAATTKPDKTPVFVMNSKEVVNEFLQIEDREKYYPGNSTMTHTPSMDFIQKDGRFVVDDRLSEGYQNQNSLPSFTDGDWIYKFPNTQFDLLTDFKGGAADDQIEFEFDAPSRNTAGTILLSQSPELKNLGDFSLFQTGELNNYSSYATHKLVPFSLTIKSVTEDGSRLAAEVDGKWYDLGMSENMNGYIAVLPGFSSINF